MNVDQIEENFCKALLRRLNYFHRELVDLMGGITRVRSKKFLVVAYWYGRSCTYIHLHLSENRGSQYLTVVVDSVEVFRAVYENGVETELHC
jgi:hypothetical protein